LIIENRPIDWDRTQIIKNLMYGIDTPAEDIIAMLVSTISDIITDLYAIKHNQKEFAAAINLTLQNSEETLPKSEDWKLYKNNMEVKEDE